jgi:hypothetical protein
MRAIVTRLIPRIVVRDAEVELCLSPGALAALLCDEPEVRSADEDQGQWRKWPVNPRKG